MKIKKILKYMFTVSLIVFLCALITGAIYVGMVSIKNIDFDSLSAYNTPVRYYDSSENEITDVISGKNTNYACITELPEHTKNAFIAIEDKRFYNHGGVDIIRLSGAAITDIKKGGFSQGGSTITQQLAKNAFLSNEKTFERKIKELKLTEKLEERFSKDEILEMYLNIIYFGNNIYGIQAASKYYFGKNAFELSLAESAVLAATINSPAKYSPVTNKVHSENRKSLILHQMHKQGLISQNELENAQRELIYIKNNHSSHNFYFEAANSELEIIAKEKHITNLGGCKVYTYFDKNTMSAVEKSLNSYELDCKKLGIIIDNNSGGIKAIYGNSPANTSRQPASILKPLAVYAPALEKGVISPATPILDEPVNFDGYKPNNFGNRHSGWISARQAVSESNNIAAVKLLDQTGINYAVNFAKRNGLKFSSQDKGLAVALGGLTDGMTLKELTQGYSTFANGGMYKESRYIKKILSPSGSLLYTDNQRRTQAMNEETAYLMLDMLKTTAKTGTASKLNTLSFDVAAKTGTAGASIQNGNTDAYCISVNSDTTVSVWIGNKSDDILDNSVRGSTYPAAINKLILEKLYQNNKPESFKKPININEIIIDSHELNLNHRVVEASALTNTKDRIKEIFGSKCKPEKIYNLYDFKNAYNYYMR